MAPREPLNTKHIPKKRTPHGRQEKDGTSSTTKLSFPSTTTKTLKTTNTNNTSGQSKHTDTRPRQILKDCNTKDCKSSIKNRSVRWNMNLIGSNSTHTNTTYATERSCSKEPVSSVNIDHNIGKQSEVKEKRIHFSRREYPTEKYGNPTLSKPHLDKTTSNKSKNTNSTTKQTAHTLPQVTGVQTNRCKARSLNSSDIILPVMRNPSTKQRQETNSTSSSQNEHKLDSNLNKNIGNMRQISNSIYTNVFDEKKQLSDSNVDRKSGNSLLHREQAENEKIDKLPVIPLSGKRNHLPRVIPQPAQPVEIPVTAEFKKRDKLPVISKYDQFSAIRKPEQGTSCYLAKTERSRQFISKLPVRIRCGDKTIKTNGNNSSGENSSNSRILEDPTVTQDTTKPLDGSNNSSLRKQSSIEIQKALIEFSPLESTTVRASSDPIDKALLKLREHLAPNVDTKDHTAKRMSRQGRQSHTPKYSIRTGISDSDDAPAAFFINKRWTDLKTRIDKMTSVSEKQKKPQPKLPGVIQNLLKDHLVALKTAQTPGGVKSHNPGANWQSLLDKSKSKIPKYVGLTVTPLYPLQEDISMSEEVTLEFETSAALDQRLKYESSISEVIKDGAERRISHHTDYSHRSRRTTMHSGLTSRNTKSAVFDDRVDAYTIDEVKHLGGQTSGGMGHQYMTRMKFDERITHSLPLAETINVATVLEDFSDKLDLLEASIRIDVNKDLQMNETITKRREEQKSITSIFTEGRSVTSLDFETINENKEEGQEIRKQKYSRPRRNFLGVPESDDRHDSRDSALSDFSASGHDIGSEDRRNRERQSMVDSMTSEINASIRFSTQLDELGKIKHDCNFIKDTMVGLFVELLQDSSLKKLFNVVSLQKEIQTEMGRIVMKEKDEKDRIEMYKLEEKMLKKTTAFQMAIRERRIWTLSDNVQEKMDFTILKRNMEAKNARVRTYINRANSRAFEKKLAKQLAIIKTDLVNEEKVHLSVCTYLKGAIKKIEKQNMDWMEKYYADRDFIESQACIMFSNRHKIKERNEAIQMVFDDYMQVVRDQKRVKQDEERKVELLNLKHKKATMIQALYRGTLSRRAFYR